MIYLTCFDPEDHNKPSVRAYLSQCENKINSALYVAQKELLLHGTATLDAAAFKVASEIMALENKKRIGLVVDP